MWQPIPQAPADFVWEPRSVVAQRHTRNYYAVDEVFAALERALLLGRADEAPFWLVEIVDMGPVWWPLTWSTLFQHCVCSLGPAQMVPTFRWMHGEYIKYKLLSTPDTLDPRCRTIMLQVVDVLARALPKCRQTDSAVRAFFFPYPESTLVRPYEPHIERAHLRPPPRSHFLPATENRLIALARERAHAATWIPSTSYIDPHPPPEGQVVSRYTLHELHDDDPPYLARWCNALCQSLQTLEGEASRRAALYYAGLIYQCTEPCHVRNRRHDSVQLLWEIIMRHAPDNLVDHLDDMRAISDEFARNSHRRERYYVVAAFFLIMSPPDAPDPLPVPNEVVVPRGLLPIPEEALDYTTRTGKSRMATAGGFLQTTATPGDPYATYALAMQRARDEAGQKDERRRVRPVIPHFAFDPVKAPSLRGMYHSDSLAWRGQFLPYGNGEVVHPFDDCLCDVRCVNSEGLFAARYHHPRYAAEGVDVYVVPCGRQVRRAFYQCLVDELKPLFGVPALGVHSLCFDRSIQRSDPLLMWSPENTTVVDEVGHAVMFRATAFGTGVHTAKVELAELNTSEYQGVRNQLINVLIMYFCLGVNAPRMLAKMVLVGDPGDPHPLVVPFGETAAFTNCTFPVFIKAALRTRVARLLLIDDQQYLMQRYFDLAQFLDWESLEIVLQRFGIPAIEWAGVVRDNLRDLRVSWVTWSHHSEELYLQRLK